MIQAVLGFVLFGSLIAELHPRVNGEGVVTFLVTIFVASLLIVLFT